jgi:hypothetical protein
MAPVESMLAPLKCLMGYFTVKENNDLIGGFSHNKPNSADLPRRRLICDVIFKNRKPQFAKSCELEGPYPIVWAIFKLSF